MRLKKDLVMLVNLLLASLSCIALAVICGWVMFKLNIDLWSGEDE